MMDQVKNPTRDPKAQQELAFGRHFTTHMVYGEWDTQDGWSSMEVVPRRALSLSPAASVLHYGQMVFEGLKAFHGDDERIRIFRLDAHLKRMQNGMQRLAMPPIDLSRAREAILSLVQRDRQEIPTGPGESLYLRPFIFASEGFLGVRPSNHFTFVVLASPVGAYYTGGVRPLRIWVEREHIRAAPGGLGAVKTSANYAASLSAAMRAKSNGYDQVLWLDGVERRWIEEVGTMNIFFRLGDEVITPPLDGTILPGITRDSVLTLLKDWDISTSESPFSLQALHDSAKSKVLREAFGTGTAAVIAPIGELGTESETWRLPQDFDLAERLRATLVGIQRGRQSDPFGWTVDLS